MKFLLSELLRTIVRSWRLVGWVLGGAVIAALAFVIFLILWVARGEWGENRLIVLFEPGCRESRFAKSIARCASGKRSPKSCIS
jgi:hypothetical protein